jgi:hypothetical protein
MMDRHEAVLEEKLAFLFQPDVLIPAQYFDTLRAKTALEPEKRLMLAVLEDAVHCFQDNLAAESDTKKKLFAEAEEWILGNDDEWTFSFASICDVFGLNPEYVRHGLSRWKEKILAKHRNAEAWEKIMNEPLAHMAS